MAPDRPLVDSIIEERRQVGFMRDAADLALDTSSMSPHQLKQILAGHFEPGQNVGTRIAVMYEGHVQQLGTPKEIYDTPANVYVATFMGSPAMNVVPAQIIIKDGVPYACVKVHDKSEQHLKLSQQNLTDWDGHEVLLGIRPETITDTDGADRNSANIAPLNNNVSITEPAGADTFVTMELGGQDIVARMRADVNVGPDQDFEFAIDMEKAVVFDPKTEMRIAP